MRLPLAYPLESRDGTLAKDSSMKNLITEVIDGNTVAMKRPGVEIGSEVVSGGVAQGMIGMDGVVYSVTNDVLYTVQFPVPYDPTSGGYSFGDYVSGSGGTYYSMYPNSLSPPGEDPEEMYPEPVQGQPGVPPGTHPSLISGGKSVFWGSGPIGETEYGIYLKAPTYGPVDQIVWGFGSSRAAYQYSVSIGGGGGYSYYVTSSNQLAYCNNGGPWIFSSFGSQQYPVSRAYTPPSTPGIPL